jgi:methylthioribose-1-phosphate isomerase
VTDNMVGHLMQQAAIDAVLVGTDRTAANGDVANKIGTYTLAVLAARHRVPFYVAAPTSSIDLAMARGADIPIEERSPDEVTHVGGKPLAPRGVRVFNPAFDVTPARLVSAIITERGIARPPYRRSLSRLARPQPEGRRSRERR